MPVAPGWTARCRSRASSRSRSARSTAPSTPARRATGRRAEIEAVLAAADSVEEFTAEVARRFARSVNADRDFWAALIEFMTVVGRDEALQARFAEHHDANREAVAASVDEWARRIGSRPAIEPRRLATAILALNNGLTLEGLLAPDEVDVELYVAAQLALVRGMRGN